MKSIQLLISMLTFTPMLYSMEGMAPRVNYIFMPDGNMPLYGASIPERITEGSVRGVETGLTVLCKALVLALPNLIIATVNTCKNLLNNATEDKLNKINQRTQLVVAQTKYLLAQKALIQTSIDLGLLKKNNHNAASQLIGS